jgi:hypothetical protein
MRRDPENGRGEKHRTLLRVEVIKQRLVRVVLLAGGGTHNLYVVRWEDDYKRAVLAEENYRSGAWLRARFERSCANVFGSAIHCSKARPSARLSATYLALVY